MSLSMPAIQQVTHEKSNLFPGQQVGDIEKITASYDGISATFRAGDKLDAVSQPRKRSPD
jgi:hypothetical protein